MNNWNTKLPLPLSKLNELEYDFTDGEGIDFEPFAFFLSGGSVSD